MSPVGETMYSVWLYGSRARGDCDALSDLDVFVAGSPPPGTLDTLVQTALTPSVSQYSWEEVVAMAAYGSLFLHHLRLEGRPLAESVGSTFLRQLLDALPSYKLFRRDIRAFKLTVGDVREAATVGSTPEFELSVLGTVLRHASVLSCYLMGYPCFGRTRAMEQAGGAFGFTPADVEAFNTLYLFHLHEDGRCMVPFQPSWDHVTQCSGQVEMFLRRLDEVADAFESRLPEANCEGQIERFRTRFCLPPPHSNQTLNIEHG